MNLAPELKQEYDSHKLWLHTNGAEGKRLDWSGRDLRGANLYRVDLSGATLAEANLYRVDLSEADLSGADLTGANLTETDLTETSLFGTNLFETDLTDANLYRADLTEATGILFANFGKHTAVAWYNGVNIGCQSRTYEDWIESGVRLGKLYGYDKRIRKMYLQFIKASKRYFDNLSEKG